MRRRGEIICKGLAVQADGACAPWGLWYPRSPNARDLHPTDEDLSVGTPDLGHPAPGVRTGLVVCQIPTAGAGEPVVVLPYRHHAYALFLCSVSGGCAAGICPDDYQRRNSYADRPSRNSGGCRTLL